MLAPLVVGFLFFAYSTISALLVINDTRIFEKVKKVPLQIGDFELQQIDQNTNALKWSLKAKHTSADSKSDQAQIDEVKLIFFDNSSAGSKENKVKFTITSQHAALDKTQEEVILSEDVVIKTSDGKFEIHSGKLRFKDSLDHLEVGNGWRLDSSEGYAIEGLEGLIDKNFKSIISQGKAKLTKLNKKSNETINITGDEITLQSNSKQSIKARGNAILLISQSQTLKANEIIIHDGGLLEAHGSVNVVTDNLNCYSNNLIIKPNPDKSPKTAIFTGSPHLVKGSNTIYADTINYDFASKQADIVGNVHSL